MALALAPWELTNHKCTLALAFRIRPGSYPGLMGRVHRPGSGKPHPSGPRWNTFRAALIRSWGPAPLCFLCGHKTAPGLVEVEHRISPIVRPDLAWSKLLDNGERQLVPVHGGGKSRCAPPPEGCGLACNQVSSNAPDAPRDKNGASLPFTESFMSRQMALRAKFLARTGVTERQPAKVQGSSPLPPRGEIGREW